MFEKIVEASSTNVTVTANSFTREYGDDNPQFTYTTSGGTITGTPKITCSATKTSPVGTYTIKIEKGSVTNDNVTYVDGTLTITKAPLTISAGTYTKKQGEDNPEFTLTYNGFKNNETEAVLTKKPTATTTATKESAPGEYPVTVSGGEAQNYAITHINGKLIVTEEDAIIVTALSYTREYGDQNPTFKYTVSGGTLTGTPQITCSATRKSTVGTYTIAISKGSVTNSNVTYVDGTLTITSAALTITAKSYTREEGEPNPTFEVTYNGFKNLETESALTTKPTVTTEATLSSPPGTYDLVPSGAGSDNYSINYVNGTLIVTEKREVTFAVQGITYLGINASKKAEIRSVEDGMTEVNIPSSVTYNGKTYQVTSLANNVFSGRTFNYVSLPSTITSIATSAFYNCTLGALIWNANSSLPSSIFSNMAMSTKSNFLLYVNSTSYAPSNVSNVVVGSSASSITLADGTNTHFYCPKEFTAQTISYTHHYGMITGGNGKGWETIALPFDVKKIEHSSKGVLTPFASYQKNSDQRPFWLYELGGSGFKKTDAIKANTPYIISMPNNTSYDSEYILSGDVTFSASNAKVYQTENLVTSTSNGKTFVPSFAVKDAATSVYPLNVTNTFVVYSGSYDAGSRFISNLRNVYPFEAYMTTSSFNRVLPIEFDDNTTGIDEIPLADGNKNRVKIYTLGGQLLIDSNNSEWESQWHQLPSGVYIKNGKKVIK